MRPRHTFRTDDKMDGDRRQTSVRLSGFYRERMKEVLADGGLSEIHSESDLIQDAVWLWFHEYDWSVEQGVIQDGKGARSPDDRVGTTPERFPASEELEVGSSAEAGESFSGEPSEDQDAQDQVVSTV
jgi:hypothetical protein